MRKFRGVLSRTKSHDANSQSAPAIDSPEANAAQGVKQFCEAPSDNSGEEAIYLPVIVEAAESSPQAAASAAYQIRKCLSKGESRVQYNAVMLIRILADNPGPSFTRNMDAKFVDTVKNVLKNGRDPSVQQILRETLDALEADKSHDNGLFDLLAMWRSIKGHSNRIAPAGRVRSPPVPRIQHPQPQYAQPVFLPPAPELASRVEEARNTAKILLQLVQSTPTDNVLDNELIKEFSERCQSAQRSMQEYINCDNPVPDDDTLQTLIETNEQLSLALSRHQRAVLSARRALGSARDTPSPHVQNPLAPPPPSQSYAATTQPAYATSTTAPSPVSPIAESFTAPAGPPPSHFQNNTPPSHPAHDPFADPRDYDNVDHNLDYTEHHPAEPRHYGPDSGAGRPGYPVTDSYLGRQYSAANGLTMHGAGDVSPVQESGQGQSDVRYRY